MISMRETLQYLAEALRVRRCHAEPVLHRQTVGEHSCGVAILCELLWEEPSSPNLLLAAITHDLGERRWGDMPGNVKDELALGDQFNLLESATLGELGLRLHNPLTAAETRTLALADKLDLLLHCCVERAHGNQLMRPMYQKVIDAVRSFQPLSSREAEVFVSLKSLWRTYDEQGN